MINKLKNIDLHDQSLEALQLDFSSNEITIKLGIYNEDRSDYDYLQVIFSEVEKIDIGQMRLDDSSSIEIYSHEVLEDSIKPTIKFLFLTGFGKASSEFSFSFRDCQITDVQFKQKM